jgi:hypothetical protein
MTELFPRVWYENVDNPRYRNGRTVIHTYNFACQIRNFHDHPCGELHGLNVAVHCLDANKCT